MPCTWLGLPFGANHGTVQVDLSCKNTDRDMPQHRYILSFTSGGLLRQGSCALARSYLELGDWSKVTDHALAESILQYRTLSATKRNCREIIARLQTLRPEELELLVAGNLHDQEQLLWLAICRRYRFIADFTLEVLRDKALSLRRDLSLTDIDAFIHSKSLDHPELESLKDSTRKKLRQVLFTLLHDVRLVNAEDRILQPLRSVRLNHLLRSSPDSLRFLLVSDFDIKGLLP